MNQTLKGFRDFLPEEAIKRNQVLTKFRNVFETYGFDPMETPALEYADVLLGKYGEDADKLMYIFEDRGGRKIGLRYDQTVPTARVVAQYTQELPRPFKRYQIQPVWRAENTQKGRYREFLQCDADILGETYTPLADAEMLAVFYALYGSLGFPSIKILVNSRHVLKDILTTAHSPLRESYDHSLFLSLVRSIDKLSKIGREGVSKELEVKGIPASTVETIFTRISDMSSPEALSTIDSALSETLLLAHDQFGIPRDALVFDPTLARGLDYYTGIIFESTTLGYPGSLGGGGRYDNLIGQMGGPDTPAVGFAVGFDRTIEVATELGLLTTRQTTTDVLITVIDEGDSFTTALGVLQKLRTHGIPSEISPLPKDKLDKQMKYAERKGIPYIIVIGPDEAQSGQLTLKHFESRQQEKLNLDAIINKLTQSS